MPTAPGEGEVTASAFWSPPERVADAPEGSRGYDSGLWR